MYIKFYKKYIKFHKFSFKSFIIFNFIHNLHVKEARCYISNNIFQLFLTIFFNYKYIKFNVMSWN